MKLWVVPGRWTGRIWRVVTYVTYLVIHIVDNLWIRAQRNPLL